MAWGDAASDSEAEGLMRTLRDRYQTFARVNIGLLLALVVVAVWYGVTGQAGVLALEIVLAVLLTVAGVRREMVEMHILLAVAEARTRTLELTTQQLSEAVGSLPDRLA